VPASVSGIRPPRFLVMGQFALVGASGLVVNQILLWLLVSRGHLHYLVAAILATQESTTWNYALVEVGTVGGSARPSRPLPLHGQVDHYRCTAWAARVTAASKAAGLVMTLGSCWS
jgi:GtrA-like protein